MTPGRLAILALLVAAPAAAQPIIIPLEPQGTKPPPPPAASAPPVAPPEASPSVSSNTPTAQSDTPRPEQAPEPAQPPR